MDHQQQTQQTEKIIIEMLEFLETSSDEDNDLGHHIAEMQNKETNSIKEDFDNDTNTKNLESKVSPSVHMKKHSKTISNSIAKELIKLKKQLQWTSNEFVLSNKKQSNSINCKPNLTTSHQNETDCDSLYWQYKLENHCRRSCNNSYTQEVYKAIYQDTIGHPANGSADYYQAAQNYVIYGKHFLDFPQNLQVLLNESKNSQIPLAENSNLITNLGNGLYPKPNTAAQNTSASPSLGLATSAASAAAYYQISNSMQAQTRPALSTNSGNSTAYGIFLGNKVTYVAGTPTTPPLIYNQHSTTTNFISNSLANAALSTSPTILYTNPMLTTTTQQYLTQFLSTAALTANSLQSANAATTANSAGIYERLIYSQMLQQQLYQAQQAAAVAAMFQHKQRIAATASRQTVMTVNANRSSPQQVSAETTPYNTNGLTLNTCNSQSRCSSPSETAALKPQPSGTTEKSKSFST